MKVSLADIYAELRIECAKAGGQANWAATNGISKQYVCDVLNARRDPGPKILKVLGLKSRVVYWRDKA